jgi:serine/threonine protein kinase
LKEMSPKESSEGSSSHKESQFVAGAVDLALEAKILSELQHENIIRLVAVTTGCYEEAFAQKGGFFIVLELLEETLHDRLHTWGRSTSMLATGTSSAAILERMESTVLGIARAMSHLHQNKIVLRDLKPENVGFCASGTVKLFDFGLARPVDDVKGSSEFAGSLRYMAPEAVLARGTSLASDVYSFGVLLWQICTLQQPFKKYAKISQFKEKVILGKYRPSVHGLYSLQLSKLIETCWDFEPEVRPTFAMILDELKTIVSDLSSYKKLPSSLKGQKRASYSRRATSLDSADLGCYGKFGRMPIYTRSVSLMQDTRADDRHSVGYNTTTKMQELPEIEEASRGRPVRGRPRNKNMDTCSCGNISSHSPRRQSHRRDCSVYCEGSVSEVSDNDGMSGDMKSDILMSENSCCRKSSTACDASFKGTPSRSRAGIFGGFKFRSLSFHPP